MGGKIAVVLRPCEIRAFTELVKLRQGLTEEVVVIGLDCLGAYHNMDYLRSVGENSAEFTARFYKSILSGNGSPLEGIDLAPACKACEHPIPENVDILIGLFGMDPDQGFLQQGLNPNSQNTKRSLRTWKK